MTSLQITVSDLEIYMLPFLQANLLVLYRLG